MVGIKTFSPAEINHMCEPILKDARLVKDEEEMEDFVQEAKQKMIEARAKQVKNDEPEEQTLEYMAPPRPWPGEQIDFACK